MRLTCAKCCCVQSAPAAMLEAYLAPKYKGETIMTGKMLKNMRNLIDLKRTSFVIILLPERKGKEEGGARRRLIGIKFVCSGAKWVWYADLCQL